MHKLSKYLIYIGRPWWWLIKIFFDLGVNFCRHSAKIIVAGVKSLKKVKIDISWKYLILSWIFFGLSAALYWFYQEVIRDLPNINDIYNPPILSSKIYDRNGRLLYKFYKNENRSWITLNKIPQTLVWATLAIEDKNFYRHRGISLKGIIGAIFYNNFRKGENGNLRGGSTITQQLVKNVFFSGEKSIERKMKEAILALILETKLNKDEILERYFNQVPYGGDTYGAQEAALKYFDKNVWELEAAEAAFLAGLPAAPSSYSPFGNNPEFAFVRQRQVIHEMVRAGFIGLEKAEELLNENLKISDEKTRLMAPHFVFYIRQLLEEEYKFENFERLGLKITTSLDIATQEIAQKIVKEEVEKVKNLRISNGAALVVDVKKGDILAMVGSKDYYADNIDGKYNVTTALRQPGSAIKPINYLLALTNGWSLSSSIDDTPVSYYLAGQKPYSPQNYNGKYMGRVTLKVALASSLNVPSVKLLSENGVDKMIDLASAMGISTWNERSRYGLALALGSGEVKMTELAQAYSVFANMGDKVKINPIVSIENYLGEVVYKKIPSKEKLVESGYAFLINNALSDNQARTPIFGPNSLLKIDSKVVAVKTGTTNNLKDNWCIGWTPSYLVAAWVGNNNGQPMSWVASGITGATPIWNKIMKEVLSDKAEENWDTPMGVYKAKACGKEDYFMNGSEGAVECRQLVNNGETRIN